METSLALQKVLLVTVSLARHLYAERRHGVSSCLDRIDRVLYPLRSGYHIHISVRNLCNTPTLVARNQRFDLQEGTVRAGKGHYPWLWQGALLVVERRDAKARFHECSAMPSLLARVPPRGGR